MVFIDYFTIFGYIIGTMYVVYFVVSGQYRSRRCGW